MQFLMGLNENYEHARTQVLMANSTPNLNNGYSREKTRDHCIIHLFQEKEMNWQH